jgi:transcription termination factor Rho
MSVLDRSALVESPLADLHAIASELSIDGFRRLRRDELIEAIIEKQGGDPSDGKGDRPEEEAAGTTRRRRSRRGGRAAAADTDTEPEQASEASAESEEEAEEAPKPRRPRSRSRKSEPEEAAKEEATTEPADADEERPARSRRGRAKATDERPEGADADEESVEGTVEVLANGSGFVRLGGSPEGDVYISSAQVKRCELVSGDTVTGPKRAPRRSERYASLIRIETINGRPASEQADTVRFDDLPAALPSELIDLTGADAALKAVQAVAPFGRGSRVTITGPSRAGKTELLRTIAAALSESELTVSVALAGVRPEEIGAWSPDQEPALPAPAGAVGLSASEDARAGALEPVVDQARRLAARGTHAVVLIDTLDGLSAYAARKLMASARNLTDGGSVTIIATAGQPVGGETTVIALDLGGATTGRFPAIDALASGTLRPERLVSDTAARKIIRDRAKALKES